MTVPTTSVTAYEQGLPATAGATAGDVPVVQSDGTIAYESAPSGLETGEAYTLTFDTPSRTLPNATATSVPTTTATNSTPYGYSQVQANDIVAAINANITDINAVREVVAALVTDLITAGIIAS